MDALREDDVLGGDVSGARPCPRQGLSARSIMAEMYGKAEGCSRGRGGSMHLFDADTTVLWGKCDRRRRHTRRGRLALADNIAGRTG